MRGLTRRWLFRTPDEQDASSRLPLFERVLRARGVHGKERVRQFCEPKLTDLHEPGLMPGLDAAVQRLADAMRGGERIAIYGDYDVDGIAAGAILYRVMRALKPDVDLSIYIPHRLEEGYGLNADALRQLREQGVQVVISVDCGVTARQPAQVAREIGLELIITDHHNLPQEGALPDAVAVVHPRLAGGAYPFGDLCGAGVAYKVAWGLAVHWCGSQRLPKPMQRTMLDLLPLAALGTIADVVPLLDENRALASWGLRWIKETPITGLRALIEASDLAGAEIDSHKVGFVLGPRLNACGRLGHAAEAVRLLTDAPEPEARAIAERLTKLNRQRQQTERRIAEQAAQLAEDAGMTGMERRAIVLAHDDWHPGVIGIVCSRLVDRFHRPTILLQRQGGECKGSARSIDGYSIHEALAANAGHLVSFGGHDAAAGLAVRTEQLDAFAEALTAHANAHIADEHLVPGVVIDCDASLAELELEAVRRIGRLSPFGRDNPHPAVRVTDVILAEAPRQIGANGRHLTLNLRADDKHGRRRFLRAVWFGAGERAADLAAGMPLEVVIEPKINAWNGREDVEGILQDLRVVAP